MRLLIAFLLLLHLQAVCADDKEIWAHIGDLQRQITLLDVKINGLQRPLPPYILGQELQGGVIFYVDDTGRHGLIVSKNDAYPTGVQWRNGPSGNRATNARADGIQAGESNTRLIIAQQTIDNQKGVFAASLAANYQILADGSSVCTTPQSLDKLCYSGWYLASAFELQLLYRNLASIHLISMEPTFYWSSTEASVARAWIMDFANGQLSLSPKGNSLGRVRPIRRF